MCAAIALRNIIGEALHRFLVRVIPLHRDLGSDSVFLDTGVKDIGMQDIFVPVHVFDKAFYATGECEVFFLAVALVDQRNFDAVIQE